MQFSKIGLVLAQKWKRMNQMSTPPFWGVFREVFGVRSKIWALEVPFFCTWKRALLPKVPVSVLQPKTLAAPPWSCCTPTPAVEEALHRKLLAPTALSHRAKMEPTEFLPKHFLILLAWEMGSLWSTFGMIHISPHFEKLLEKLWRYAPTKGNQKCSEDCEEEEEEEEENQE